MGVECLIHKVASNDIISENECLSCDFYNDCLFDMTSDMGDDMLDVARKYLYEIQEVIKQYTAKKVKEGEGEEHIAKKVREGV